MRRQLVTTCASGRNPPSIVLFQYSICPFCNRVKSFLDYQNLPYSIIEVNPLTKNEIKPFKDQHKQVPIAQIDKSPVFGSDKIIKTLLKNKIGQHELQHEDESEDLWVDFAVKKLAVLLYPNMCRSWADSYRAFEYVNQTPTFNRMQRFMIQNIGSLVREKSLPTFPNVFHQAMYYAASKVKSKFYEL